ncbi:MAG: hypothetical protein R6W96_04690 [Clostridia bacterium]
MESLMKISGIALALAGAVVVYGAKIIVRKYSLESRESIKADIQDEAVLAQLKTQKAVARVKIIGGLIFLPGMILLLIAFR